tara:strand:+ start:17 stop:127 length:111 start_codon:yes stop_codon:yes gene_type:complete
MLALPIELDNADFQQPAEGIFSGSGRAVAESVEEVG